MLIKAENANGSKKWTNYQTNPLNLVPDQGYWDAAPQDFELEITPNAIVPKTNISTSIPSSGTAECMRLAITRIRFSARTDKAWDPFSAPDIYLEIISSNVSLTSSLSSDNYTKLWDFPSSSPLYLLSAQSVTLKAFDRDIAFDDLIDSLNIVVPSSFAAGSFKVAGQGGEAEFIGRCVGR